MDVATQRQDGVLLVQVSGRIDHANVAAFDIAVGGATEADDVAVLMDLAKLAYINSAGLRVFVKVAKKKLRGKSAGLALCALPDGVRRIFEVTGFDNIIPIYRSRAEALDALAPERRDRANGGQAGRSRRPASASTTSR